MGRPRKPTALKILDGDRADRIPPAEPTAPRGLGDPPAWLDPVAKLAWGRMAEALEPLGVATLADREAATLYAVSYSTWYRALARVEAEGLTLETETTTKAHPCIAVANEAQRQLSRLLGKFGMTPADRAVLNVEPPGESDALLAFLAGDEATPPDGKPSKRRR